MAAFIMICAVFTVTETVFFLNPAFGIMAGVVGVYAYNHSAGVRKI